ncbi:hypothetical protein PPTG_20072, partial [Phytophthora nicotianae INRA-310]
MPHGTAKSGAKAPAKTAARKAHAKSCKRHSKVSVLGRLLRSGSEDEAKARSFRSVSGSSVGGHTPVPSEHSVDSLHSLASDHINHESQTPERSETPADEAKGSPNAGCDEGGKPPMVGKPNLSGGECNE